MSDTPETDSKTNATFGNHSCATVLADFARKLERERDEARHEIEGWSNKWECAVEMAARAEIERDEAREKCSALGKAMSYSPESTTLLGKFLQAIKERDEATSESEEQARLLGMSAEREASLRGKLFMLERELAKIKAAANEVVKVWECPPWKIGETPSNAITQLRDAIGYED
jgi:G:T-mismatch repair DNA endonuclease (very short patch repair protein)